MRELNKQERTAIETVTKRFSATRKKGGDPPDADIIVAGRRIAVDIAILKWLGIDQGNVAKPRLRFDKVATKLIERLQATLDETVPDGMTVLLTITAPIRLPSKTAAALDGKTLTLLGRESQTRDEKITIHGNRVQIRVLRGAFERAPKMIGFVHNPDTEPVPLFSMTGELLRAISDRAGDLTDLLYQAE